jgi:hypothetical protein
MAKRIDNIPLEEDEQIAFVQWCQLNKIIVHHSPLEFASSSRAVKVRALKMKKMGTSKGFPDLLVFIPIYGVTGEIDSYQMCAIEMKRRKGSTTTKEQKQWLQVLESAGIPCAVCKGAENAIEFINKIRKEISSNEGS